MYLQNKYTTWYYNIINRAKTRTLTGYKERHHIVPKSLGGENTKENLVNLTAKEHYICHGLLCKMTEGKARSKMTLALLKMCVASKTHQSERIKLNGIRYEQIRQAAGKANSGINSPTYGRKRTPEEEARRLATWRANYKPQTHTAESKSKISIANTGHRHSDDTKAQWSAIRKGRPGQDNNSGKHFWNDGVRNYLAKECPPGCVPGRHKVR